MGESKIAYVGLGSNLGERQKNLESAVIMLSQTEGVRLVRVSQLIETAPLAGVEQPRYLNAVAEFNTELSARDFLRKMMSIEAALGRTRTIKWSPRTIDLDLLLFGDEVINELNLVVPHPQMHLRTFVLLGLCQLNPALVHPVMKVPVSILAERLNNSDFIINQDIPQLVSIAGIIGSGKTTLANKLSQILNCPIILEPYDKNPYLPEVYAGKKELALDSQLFFLTHRFDQLNSDVLGKGKLYVSDYIFDKELIYAKLLLNPGQLDIYSRVHDLYYPKISPPVLVIYLTDSPQKCLERIHQRNRPYEQQIETQFLEKILAGHEELFANWKKSPVIRINTADLDYSKPDIVENLANQVACYISIQTPKQRKPVSV
jgi:deoxyguanosine kinase